MKLGAIAFFAANAVVTAAREAPTLPEEWITKTMEPGLGFVWESYKMVRSPDYSHENPSGLWTNYSEAQYLDGECNRLIHVPNNAAAKRYYINCGGRTCCTDTQSGNHVEFQIPNVHSITGRPWPVEDLGKKNITTSFGTYEADAWAWEFTAQSWIAYTMPCEVSGTCPTGAKLIAWNSKAFMVNVTIEFEDYLGIPEEEQEGFTQSFYVPSVCTGTGNSAPRPCGKEVTKKHDERDWAARAIYVDAEGKEYTPTMA